jgi:hypothetical protein
MHLEKEWPQFCYSAHIVYSIIMLMNLVAIERKPIFANQQQQKEVLDKVLSLVHHNFIYNALPDLYGDIVPS